MKGSTRMESLQIKPITKVNNNKLTVSVPGSKSITNRALLLATLAKGQSNLGGVLFSDDSRHFLKCVEDLGFTTSVNETEKKVSVEGLGGPLPKKSGSIYVGSAGTAARFLAAFLGASEGSFFVDASEQMRKRPMKPLLEALESIGAKIICTEEDGHFPMEICGKGIKNYDVTVNIDKSSQFLSALLISAPLAKEDMHIHVEGSHGMAYIEMTVKMMEQFGIQVLRPSAKEFVIPKGQIYKAQTYRIEPDASAAAYFWAMAAVLGISITVSHTHFDSLQGDVEFAHILGKMGCKVDDSKEGIMITGPASGKLKGITVDMHSCSDQAITLAAIAPFADGPVHITGISHIRLQESDRIAAIVKNLNAMGIEAYEKEDGVIIYPGEVKPTKIETFDDHRLAMGFAVTGLRAEGITILDPMCCKKTFENYFEVLEEVKEQLWQ